VRRQRARDTEEGCEEVEKWVCEGGWEKAREESCVVWYLVLATRIAIE